MGALGIRGDRQQRSHRRTGLAGKPDASVHRRLVKPRRHLAAATYRRPTSRRQRVWHQSEDAQRSLLVRNRGSARTRAATGRCRVACRARRPHREAHTRASAGRQANPQRNTPSPEACRFVRGSPTLSGVVGARRYAALPRTQQTSSLHRPGLAAGNTQGRSPKRRRDQPTRRLPLTSMSRPSARACPACVYRLDFRNDASVPCRGGESADAPEAGARRLRLDAHGGRRFGV